MVAGMKVSIHSLKLLSLRCQPTLPINHLSSLRIGVAFIFSCSTGESSSPTRKMLHSLLQLARGVGSTFFVQTILCIIPAVTAPERKHSTVLLEQLEWMGGEKKPLRLQSDGAAFRFSVCVTQVR